MQFGTGDHNFAAKTVIMEDSDEMYTIKMQVELSIKDQTMYMLKRYLQSSVVWAHWCDGWHTGDYECW